MIPRLADWTWARSPSGVVMTCTRPDFTGAVRYSENERPLERLGDLVERHTRSAVSQGRAAVVGAPRRLVTNEGEYAALIELRAGDRCWLLAFVFGDDSYEYLEADSAIGHASVLRGVVEDLVLRDAHVRGVRQRRYLYALPPWQGIGLGTLTTHYVPEAYPRVDCRISVFPAYPLQNGELPKVDLQRTMGEHILVTLPGPPGGFVLLGDALTMEISTRTGLHGYRLQLAGMWNGRNVVRDIAVLHDAQYAYALELATSPEHVTEAAPVFEELLQSVEPLPNVAKQQSATAAFTYWTE